MWNRRALRCRTRRYLNQSQRSMFVTSMKLAGRAGKGKVMPRYLLAALWPAGEAAIVAATVKAARRASRHQADDALSGSLHYAHKHDASLPGLINGVLRFGSVLTGPASGNGKTGRQIRRVLRGPEVMPGWVPDLIRLG